MAYDDFKDLPTRTVSDNVFLDKAFRIAIDSKYDRYHCDSASLLCKLLDYNAGQTGNESMGINNWLMNHTILSLERCKVYSSYRDNIWGADLADMQKVSECNIWVRFVLFAINVSSKYPWAVLLKDKKCITITSLF